jgi:hypothetical protein
MNCTALARFLNPWKFKREEEVRRVLELRGRDGEDCRRCRRPMRFDLPRGHDLAPRIEQIDPAPAKGSATPENLCLCHGRCNAQAADYTREVKERVRMKGEAELFSKARQNRAA